MNFTEYSKQLNEEYLKLHMAKEDLFWASKMGLTDNAEECSKQFSQSEITLSSFIQDVKKLHELRAFKAQGGLTPDEEIVLDGWITFFEANVIESEEGRRYAAEAIEMEGALQYKRSVMGLGYIDPATGKKVEVTSTELSNMLTSDHDEARRKAAWEGLNSIGPFVLANGFIEVIKKRNQLARACGYEDYYEFKVQRTEGFSKKYLFELLDDLERRTRDANKKAVDAFAKEHGENAILPWNFKFYRSGKLAEETDPYHPFEYAVERWVKSFAAMNIEYRSATLTLDLIDRKGKHENGFMHGPEPGFFRDGKWNPARINFTANAIPNAVGSGVEALNTLFHEGGHAAHFSNILMNAPCFSQEFAPTSVAYAETQSMFLDAVISDADWLMKYAKNKKGESYPFELIERAAKEDQPFHPLMIRAMLGVCYAEKAFYEMTDAELTPENIQKVVLGIEQRLYHLPASSRPILAVPHILAGEASAYYHGYVLAEMAVRQTREYFLSKYGYISDNPNIGPELAEGYWKPGNSESFMSLVEKLTGKPFSADALVNWATRSTDDVIAEANKLVENAKKRDTTAQTTDLKAVVKVIHGNETITKFSNGDFTSANEAFKNWVVAHYPKQVQ